MTEEIQSLIKRYLKSFLVEFVTKFYTKDEINDMFPNVEILKNININKDNKPTFNDSILYTEEDIKNLKINASEIIVEVKNNDEVTTKTLQEILDNILVYGIQPSVTKAVCGIAICGSTTCGDL